MTQQHQQHAFFVLLKIVLWHQLIKSCFSNTLHNSHTWTTVQLHRPDLTVRIHLLCGQRLSPKVKPDLARRLAGYTLSGFIGSAGRWSLKVVHRDGMEYSAGWWSSGWVMIVADSVSEVLRRWATQQAWPRKNPTAQMVCGVNSSVQLGTRAAVWVLVGVRNEIFLTSMTECVPVYLCSCLLWWGKD